MRRALAAALVLATACGAAGRIESGRRTVSPFTTAGAPPPEATLNAPATTGPAYPASARVRLTEVATMTQPLAMAVHPDGSLYVAEKTGRVVALGAGPVLDISSEVSNGSEQGLLGLAFSPDGGFLYVNFTDRSGDTRIREYPFAGAAVTGPAREVLVVDQPYANHNGGDLAFGPDKLLYIALGDGGSGGDPQGNAQNLGTLLGKMLRIDPRPASGRSYQVPDDNPFISRAGARGEIWAYGLRNPWRFSFDRATSDLWIGDVGQDSWEELDRQAAASRGGENYGWNRMEGTHRFEGSPPAGYVPPVYEYARDKGNCAVTGGYVYRGAKIPDLAGAYVFADFCRGSLLALYNGRVTPLGPTAAQLASFGQDGTGELYVMSLSGTVSRLDPA